jgi:hypothetical protein
MCPDNHGWMERRSLSPGEPVLKGAVAKNVVAKHICGRCAYWFYQTRDGLPLWAMAPDSHAEAERREQVMQQVTTGNGNTGGPEETGLRIPILRRLLLPRGIVR